MAEVLPRDVLARFGARTLLRYGTPTQRKLQADKGGEAFKETFTRPDAQACATYFDRAGTMRIAAAGKLRCQWRDTDGDGVGDVPSFLIENPGATNLIENSNYEIDAVGSVVKNGSTLLRDNAQAILGSWSLKMTVANAATSGVSFTKRDGTRMAGVATTAYTGSAWVFATGAAIGGNLRLYVDWFDAGSVYLSTSACGAAQTLVQGWQRIGGFGAIAPANSVTAIPYLVTNTATGVWSVWVDLPQWEVGEVASSAIPTGAGALSRASDIVTLPLRWGPQDMTARFTLLRPLWADAVGDIGGTQILARIGGNVVPTLDLGGRTGVRQFYGRIQPNGSLTSVNIPAGSLLDFIVQFRSLQTAGGAGIDVGTGLQAFSGPEPGFPMFGLQTIELVAFGAAEVVDFQLVRGLRTLAEMQAMP